MPWSHSESASTARAPKQLERPNPTSLCGLYTLISLFQFRLYGLIEFTDDAILNVHPVVMRCG
jgi:hypothetical protein